VFLGDALCHQTCLIWNIWHSGPGARDTDIKGYVLLRGVTKAVQEEVDPAADQMA